MRLPTITPARRVTLAMIGIALLASVATPLARYYRQQRLARAVQHLDRGRLLIQAGEIDRGLADLRAALALNRRNNDTALVLATALLDTDRLSEAQTYLDEAVDANPTSGPANLARARVARALSPDDADTYYQRAYYGSWGPGASARRLDVGFELVAYHLSRSERELARGILTQLTVDAGSDVDVLLRIARLQLDAGAPSDALPLLRTIVQRRPGDAPAWSALAAAAFATMEDQVATRAAAQALNLDKTDAQAQRIQRISSAALDMDPRAGRLSTRDRLRRALRLVTRVTEGFDACRPYDPATEPPDSPRSHAAAILTARRSADLDFDEVIDAAARLWAERTESCPVPSPELDVLARVFDRLNAGEAR